MGNDIEIRVRVSNDTAGGLAAVNTSLRSLRSNAQQAGQALGGLSAQSLAAAAALRTLHAAIEDNNRALRQLRARAAAAALSLRDLRDSANGTNNSLRTLNTRTQTADGRLTTLSSRTQALRGDMDDLDGSVGALTNRLAGLRSGLGDLPGITMRGGDGMQRLRAAAIALSPALIPIAAAAVPLAAGLGAAGVAAGVFGLAIGGQVKKLSEASDAQKKLDKAVREHGRGSAEAAKAEAEFVRLVKEMPPATRTAAAALGVLKDQYKGWSDSLADDTMPVATKSFAAFGALLPRLTPLVRGTSSELDRLMTVMAGGIQSQGFERFMNSFASFAEGALSKGTDGLIRFSRVMQGGAGSSQFTEFMAYVREVGPAVGDTLQNLARAMVHLVASASDLGVSMLGFVNALASLVNAVPSEVISTLLQLVVAIKAVQLAAAGMAAVSAGMAAFGASIVAMRTAAAGASGGLASLAAAFGALSRGARVALIGTGIGVLVLALSRLSEVGRQAPPDIDKMTTAIGRLGESGKVGGEAARVLGRDFGQLSEALRTLARPSNAEGVQQFLTSLIGMDSTPVKDAKEKIDGLDKAMANLVKGGNADLAEAAFKRAAQAMRDKGLSAGELRGQLDDYKAALADVAFEEQLAAEAQGLFGQQALSVQSKLEAQKASADGLRQSIEALNDANRSALGGMVGFEAAIDAAAQAASANAGSLRMINGQLDLNSPKAQAAATALNDLASKTKDAATSARESGQSWEQVNSIYARGRAELLTNAKAMGLTGAQARQLADQIMRIPSDKQTRIKMQTEDAVRGLDSVIAKLRDTKGKSVTVRALTQSAVSVLESLGYKVKRLPDGRVTVTANSGPALRGIGAVQAARNALRDKSITLSTTIRRNYVETHQVTRLRGPSGAPLLRARGGPVPGYADGGDVQVAPTGLVKGPGTGTSDSILAMFASGAVGRISNAEYVVNAQATRRFLPLLEAINSGKIQGLARGGLTKSEAEARHGAVGDLTISRFGWMAGYRRSEFANALGRPEGVGQLVSALNQWRGVIMKASHGGTERSLLRHLDSVGRSLLRHEKSLNSVTGQLEKAKTKLADLRQAASQLRDSVKNNILGAANITRSASGERTASTADVMGGLIASRDKATSFARALKDLKKKGLSKHLLAQVAEAGIEGGGLETATAMLGASRSEIASMNRLHSQISSAASSAGSTAADAMYAASLKTADHLVKRLGAQQSRLERSMDRLASSMERAVERMVFSRRASGGVVGAAASGGIRSGMTLVGEQGAELVHLAAGSRVRSNPDTRRYMQDAASASGTVVVEIHSGGSRLDDLLVEILRKAIRVKGGDVQLVLGRR